MDISLDNFQGPMDLLLHLVRKKEMDIMDIKIEIIIDEYLNYINNLENKNLNIASSYLVVASELLEIKSRMLLPNSNDKEEVEELKENLINRIVEYEKYKELVPIFKNKELERREYKTKSPSSIIEYKSDLSYKSDLTSDVLVLAYKKMLERIEYEKPITTKVTKREISVESQILRIKEKFKYSKKIEFDNLFDTKTKEYLVATFLAVLEMVKFGEIKVYQDCNFDKILCEAI